MTAELLSLSDPLLLGASVLEPDLDLGVSQLQILGEVCSLSDGEVGLALVLVLQFLQLVGGEGCPRLAVSSVLPQDGSSG